MQSLRDRGYIKGTCSLPGSDPSSDGAGMGGTDQPLPPDQVFGCPLAQLCEREKSPVPRFVQQCIRTVEARGTYACTDKAERRGGLLEAKEKAHVEIVRGPNPSRVSHSVSPQA